MSLVLERAFRRAKTIAPDDGDHVTMSLIVVACSSRPAVPRRATLAAHPPTPPRGAEIRARNCGVVAAAQ